MNAVQRYFKDVVDGFMTVLVGMVVTGREFVQHKERVITLEYPKHRKEMPPRFRGMLFNDVHKCIACALCAKECPVDCITVVGTGKGKARKPESFIIDFNKCMWCDLCVEMCPVESLFMTHEYEVCFRNRKDMIVDFMKIGEAPPRPMGEEVQPEKQYIGSRAKIPVADMESSPTVAEEKEA